MDLTYIEGPTPRSRNRFKENPEATKDKEAMASVSEIKAILKNKAPEGGENTLYEHLAKVLLRVVHEKSDRAYKDFELISHDVKAKAGANDEKPKKDEGLRSGRIEYGNSIIQLEKQTKSDDDEEDEETCKVQSFPDLLELSCWAGVSKGEEEMYKLYLAMRKLAKSLPSAHGVLKYWGSITSTKGRYTIVQGSNAEYEVEDVKAEEGMDGLNKYAYWVSSCCSQQPFSFVRLPNITPLQVVESRKISRYLTGDLDSPVFSYPPFPGNEAVLLRAMISRITSSTHISPTGVYILDEEAESPTVIPQTAEGLQESPAGDVRSLESWCHHEYEIKSNGRCRSLPAPEEDEEIPSGHESDYEMPDCLREISVDHWSFRRLLTPVTYVILRSSVWPGAVTISRSPSFLNLYIGDGLKSGRCRPLSLPPLHPQSSLSLVEPDDLLIDPTPPLEEDEES